MRQASVYVLVALASGLVGCAGPRVAPPRVGRTVSPAPLTGEGARCVVAASQQKPLLTEWPSSEKARLETLLTRGPVAVAYSGCTMRVLEGCALPGGYNWQRTTPSTDGFEIADEDALWAKLPLGAVALSGELKRWGKLTVRTKVAGVLQLRGLNPQQIPSAGECAQATHVIGALSVGAFELSHGGGFTVGGGADVTLPVVLPAASVGGGETVTQGSNVMRAAGDPAACELGGDTLHPNCRSPIQAFLWAIPGRVADEGPPGRVKVDLVSGNASSRWDVYVDDEVICTTPCTRWLDPARPVFFRTRDDGLNTVPDRLQLANLAPYSDYGPLQLQARPTERGEFVTGITFAGLGGMAAFTGGFLWLAGSQGDRPELGTAGMITAGVGALVGFGSVWLILDSMPKAEVYALDGTHPVKISAGPTSVSGTF